MLVGQGAGFKGRAGGPQVLLEIRRARFQSATPSHVRWTLNYSSFPPARSCNDSDPLATLEGDSGDASIASRSLQMDLGLLLPAKPSIASKAFPSMVTVTR